MVTSKEWSSWTLFHQKIVYLTIREIGILIVRDKQAGYKPQLEPPNIQENFAKGIWKDEINKHAQKRHQNKDIPHTPQDGKSRTLFNSNIDIELLYNEFKGKGEFEKNENSEYDPRERVYVGELLL